MLKKLISITRAVALSILAGVAFAEDVPGEIICKDYDQQPTIKLKPKTITIYNNTDGTIYPVISTSNNSVNEWVQGCLRTKDANPTKYVYKLYVNEGQGIPAQSSVTISLPLYSNSSVDKYITWWNGGRVVLADKNDRLLGKEDISMDMVKDVSCAGNNTDCKLSLYYSLVQFPENIYAQLSEYTFGDSIIPDGQELRILKPDNVGYNISYVDHVYLPVAIGPKNNPYIGYSGSAQPISKFRQHLEDFLQTPIGEGWPVYNLDVLKLPGGYNIFAQRSGTLPPEDDVPVKPDNGFPPVLTVVSCLKGDCSEEQKKSLHFGKAVQRMQNLWASCVNWEDDVSQYQTETVDCPQDLKDKLEAVQKFFKKNHEQYMAMHKAELCNETPDDPPVPFTYWEAVKHIYGWVPFNEGCGAAANPLVNTTIPGWDHAKIQSMYIHDLQYNYQSVGSNMDLLFNPYVQLIHDDKYLAMDAYGFSVDDAVGFMSELGDGLIFAVGGTKGLENKQQFNYADGFSLAFGVPKSMEGKGNLTLIKKYGVCVLNQDASNPNCAEVNENVIMPEKSQIAGFRVGTVASYPIKVRFTDLNDNIYTFTVNSSFAVCKDSKDPACLQGVINKQTCSVTKSDGQVHPNSSRWCTGANPNQQKEKQLTKNYLSFPAPVDYMP